MKQIIVLIFIVAMMASSCDNLKKKTKETINKGGEIVGKSASEFGEGLTEGVEQTLQCEISLSQNLKDAGLKTGKFIIESDSNTNKNKLILYIITEKDFNASLTAKVYNKKGLEIGRAKIEVNSKAGSASYYDFVFDKRTHIEVRSKITIE